MKITASAAAVLVFSLFAGTANAVLLSFTPSTPSIGLGEAVSVDLNISGLTDSAAPSLGAFLVEITFDESIVSIGPNDVTYGLLLGNPDPLSFETDIQTTVGTSIVTVDEGSFLFDFELDALQGSSFTLVTLVFQGQAVGTSTLGFGTIDLSDASFPATTLAVTGLQPARITVVPVPATGWLLLTGLAALIRLASRQNCRSTMSKRVPFRCSKDRFWARAPTGCF